MLWRDIMTMAALIKERCLIGADLQFQRFSFPSSCKLTGRHGVQDKVRVLHLDPKAAEGNCVLLWAEPEHIGPQSLPNPHPSDILAPLKTYFSWFRHSNSWVHRGHHTNFQIKNEWNQSRGGVFERVILACMAWLWTYGQDHKEMKNMADTNTCTKLSIKICPAF